jgi:hypothetical protein
MGENIKNGRRYLILGQNSISSPIFSIFPHYEKPAVNFYTSLKIVWLPQIRPANFIHLGSKIVTLGSKFVFFSGSKNYFF